MSLLTAFSMCGPYSRGDREFLDEETDRRLVHLRPTLRRETGGELRLGACILVCRPFNGVTVAHVILNLPANERVDTVANVRRAIDRLVAVDPVLAAHMAAALRTTEPDEPTRPPNVFD